MYEKILKHIGPEGLSSIFEQIQKELEKYNKYQYPSHYITNFFEEKFPTYVEPKDILETLRPLFLKNNFRSILSKHINQ